MKKNHLLLFLFITITAYSQVGVNTQKPQGIFHVDSKNNNSSSSATSLQEQQDDFAITSQGNVGIGTISPSTKLDVDNGATSGAIRIADGNQGEGKVLTSNQDGIATWKEENVRQISNYQRFVCDITSDLKLEHDVSTTIPGLNEYTAKQTGKYLVVFHCFFSPYYDSSTSTSASAAGMKSFYFRTYVNGTLTNTLSNETYAYVDSGDSFLSTNYSTVVSLNAGDVLSYKVVAAIGAPLIIKYEFGSTHISKRNIVEVSFLGR